MSEFGTGAALRSRGPEAGDRSSGDRLQLCHLGEQVEEVRLLLQFNVFNTPYQMLDSVAAGAASQRALGALDTGVANTNDALIGHR